MQSIYSTYNAFAALKADSSMMDFSLRSIAAWQRAEAAKKDRKRRWLRAEAGKQEWVADQARKRRREEAEEKAREEEAEKKEAEREARKKQEAEERERKRQEGLGVFERMGARMRIQEENQRKEEEEERRRRACLKALDKKAEMEERVLAEGRGLFRGAGGLTEGEYKVAERGYYARLFMNEEEKYSRWLEEELGEEGGAQVAEKGDDSCIAAVTTKLPPKQ